MLPHTRIAYSVCVNYNFRNSYHDWLRKASVQHIITIIAKEVWPTLRPDTTTEWSSRHSIGYRRQTWLGSIGSDAAISRCRRRDRYIGPPMEYIGVKATQRGYRDDCCGRCYYMASFECACVTHARWRVGSWQCWGRSWFVESAAPYNKASAGFSVTGLRERGYQRLAVQYYINNSSRHYERCVDWAVYMAGEWVGEEWVITTWSS